MKYIYLLVLLVMVGGFIYEFNNQSDNILHRDQQIQALNDKVDRLKANVTDLKNNNTGLTANLSAAQNKIADLNSQLDAVQNQISTSNDARDKSTAAAAELNKTADDAKAATDKIKKQIDTILHPSPPSNNLGTFTTLDGKTYQKAYLMKVESGDIVFTSSSGTQKVFFPFLPANLQSKFGYDPLKPGDLSPAQVKYQEDIRAQARD